MMYGFAPTSLEDPIIHIADEGAQLGASLLEPGGTFINIIPILRHVPAWFPGATAKKMAVRARSLAEDMKRIPMERVKDAMVRHFVFRTVPLGLMILIESGCCSPVACDKFLGEESYHGFNT